MACGELWAEPLELVPLRLKLRAALVAALAGTPTFSSCRAMVV
jgi:hypothetical protein